MENQHRHIAGYRELTPDEIANMNVVKRHGAEVHQLIDTIRRLPDVDGRWVSIAQTHLQQGFMALVRAIAKPEGF